MKYCSNCGRGSDDLSKFCENCGRTLGDPSATDSVFEVGGLAMDAASVNTAPAAPIDGAAARKNVFNPKIESHLVKAIISTVCCCLPFGIVAIVYAAKVDSLQLQGDDYYEAAIEASQKANMWGNLSIGIGILVSVLWAVVTVIAGAIS